MAHDDAPEVQALEKALDAYHSGGAQAALAPGAKIDICAIWKKVKPVVEGAIKLLKILPFAWAKKLAGVLQDLANALNVFCP